MSLTPIEDSINRLLEVQHETRDLLREAHSTLRDLRQIKREIEKLLGPTAHSLVEHEVSTLVKKALDDLTPKLKNFSTETYDRVSDQIQKLIDLAMGQEFSVKAGREDIRPLLALKLRAWIQEIILTNEPKETQKHATSNSS